MIPFILIFIFFKGFILQPACPCACAGDNFREQNNHLRMRTSPGNHVSRDSYSREKSTLYTKSAVSIRRWSGGNTFSMGGHLYVMQCHVALNHAFKTSQLLLSHD